MNSKPISAIVATIQIVSGILAFTIEIGLYVMAIAGKITYIQLIAGFAMMKVAGYCDAKAREAANGKR